MASTSIVTRDVLSAFAERIAVSLQRRPCELDLDEHRARIADLVTKVGVVDHYVLLGIQPLSPFSSVADGYEDLARIVSPSHSGRLGKDWLGTLEVLFERVTEAYLVLSDPDRRSAYDRLEQIDVNSAPRSETQVKEERREQAAALFARAQGCLRNADFHFAVELLKEATRLEPEAEYFALLGEAQSKNPNWLHHSLESYAKAIDLDFSQTPWMLRHAQILEEAGRLDEARERFDEVLSRQPNHPEAMAGLARVAGEVQTRKDESRSGAGKAALGIFDILLSLVGLRRNSGS